MTRPPHATNDNHATPREAPFIHRCCGQQCGKQMHPCARAAKIQARRFVAEK
jgi:hypothetical protein